MRRLLLYCLLALQITGLAWMYAMNLRALDGGSYFLKVRPIDPRDLLRGDYIVLGYDISWLPSSVNESSLPNKVFVILEKNGEFWSIASVLPQEPAAGVVYLKADRRGRQLIYDIERYYVREGHGTPSGEMKVEVAITDGQARIKQLFVNNQPWD